MTVVSNAGPLIALAKIGHFDLLRRVFGRLAVPEAVYREVVVKGVGRPGADEVQAATGAWIEIVSVQETALARGLSTGLGPGESEAITLALEASAGMVLLDDGKARASAQFMGLNVSGTVGVLVRASKVGLLTDLRQALDDLRSTGFRISEQVYTAALSRARETESPSRD